MTGLEPVVVGFLIQWAGKKARKVGEQVDSKFDVALTALVDRVLAKIGGDPAVRQLQQEAVEGVNDPRTAKRVELSLEDAVQHDSDFATALQALVKDADRHSSTGGSVVIYATASDNAQQAFAGGN